MSIESARKRIEWIEEHAKAAGCETLSAVLVASNLQQIIEYANEALALLPVELRTIEDLDGKPRTYWAMKQR